MKTAVSLGRPVLADARAPMPPWPTPAARLAAYVALTKPRIAVMVLVTVAAGFLLGARGASHPSTLLLTLLGTGLVAGGASAWNQYPRARPRRSGCGGRRAGPCPAAGSRRPRPRRSARSLGVVGPGDPGPGRQRGRGRAWRWRRSCSTSVVYTPLKPLTTLNTAVGAIPGALPPVIGWAAATGRLGVEAWALFLIVFLWQFPHFLAIAWIYRDDYARGGHRMLPTVDPDGAITGRQAAGYALALIPAGLLPAVVGLAGPLYFAGALALGLFYLVYAVRFWSEVSDPSARRLLRASFVYLPAILLLLLLNPMPA